MVSSPLPLVVRVSSFRLSSARFSSWGERERRRQSEDGGREEAERVAAEVEDVAEACARATGRDLRQDDPADGAGLGGDGGAGKGL